MILRFAPLVALCVAACGTGSMSGGAADMATAPDLRPAGNPITAPKSTWTFVPIEGAVCDDGSATGIGVYLTDSPNVLVFLNGGGACWNYDTCVTLNTSTHGPFQAANFDAAAPSLSSPASIFSEADGAAFKGWNKVYVPYCTGDIHGGDAVQSYMKGGVTAVVHHKGYVNIKLALARLGATIPSPAKLMFTGSSAGGYGAVINFTQARATWPAAKSYLIDDSGPIFIGDGISSFLKDGWIPAWNLDATVIKLCPECKDGDWSLIHKALGKSFPNDRMALLATESDATIGGYLLKQPSDFKTDLYKLATMVFDPTANFRYFIQTGKTHTMLLDEDKHTVGGVNVADWVKQMVTDDAGWKAVKP